MTSIPTFYLQSCPVCSRPLRVPVQFLGQSVVCQHCRGTFVARDPSASRSGANDWRPSLHLCDPRHGNESNGGDMGGPQLPIARFFDELELL